MVFVACKCIGLPQVILLVQIESFAMVLAQILHVRGLSTTAAASSMRVAPQPSVADIDTENKAPANLPYHFELSSDGRIVQDSVTLDDKLSNVNSSQADGTQPTPRRYESVHHYNRSLLRWTLPQ